MKTVDENTYLALLKKAGAPSCDEPKREREPVAQGLRRTASAGNRPHEQRSTRVYAEWPSQKPEPPRPTQTVPVAVPERVSPAPALPAVRPHKLRVIQEQVAIAFSVTRDEIISMHRFRRLLVPRHAAIWMCKQLTEHSLSEIGRRFGRDHTTAIHAIQKTEQKRREDPDFKERTDALLRKLEELLGLQSTDQVDA